MMKILLLALLFLSAPLEETAWAHDCSSPADCERVIKNHAWLIGALAAFLAWVASQKSKPEVKKRKFEAKDCAEAGAMLSQQNAGETHLVQAWTTKSKLSPNADGTWSARGEVTMKVDAGKTTITIPEWTNIDRSNPALVTAWNDAMKALEVHEQGHIGVAVKTLKEMGPQEVRAGGKDPTEAQGAYDKAAKAKADEMWSKVAEREAIYDDVTDSGRSQSRLDPNQKDVVLRCP